MRSRSNTSTAAAPERDFNLRDALSLAHRAVYGPGDTPHKSPTLSDYSQACHHMESVYAASRALERSFAGLKLLCELLESGGQALGIQSEDAKAISGLLRPMGAELEQHGKALRAAVGAEQPE